MSAAAVPAAVLCAGAFLRLVRGDAVRLCVAPVATAGVPAAGGPPRAGDAGGAGQCLVREVKLLAPLKVRVQSLGC